MLMNFNWSNLNISFDYVLNSYAIVHYKSIKFKGVVCYICMCLCICIHTLVMHPRNGYYYIMDFQWFERLYAMLSFTLVFYILTTNYFKNMYTMFLVKSNTCIYIIVYYLRYIIKLQKIFVWTWYKIWNKNQKQFHILIINGQVYLWYINMDIMTMVKGIRYNVHDIRYGMRL
jgi:hypothetical protein